MEDTNTRWQERCERYFSSMLDVRHQSKSKPTKEATSRRADVYKVDKDGHPMEGARYPHHPHNYVTTFSDKKHPAKGLLKWLSGLDLHGTSMLPRTRSSSYCALWIAISLLAAGLFCTGAYLLVKEYSKLSYIFRPETSTNGTNASPLSLLLCNSNRIRKSRLEASSRFQVLEDVTLSNPSTPRTVPNSNKLSISDLLRRTNLKSFLEEHDMDDTSLVILSDINDGFNFYGGMKNDSDWYALALSVLNTNLDLFPPALRLTSLELQDFGHGMQGNILQCSKNARNCDSVDITYIQTTELGNCAKVFLSRDESYFNTLTLTVDIQPEEYLDLVSPAPSIQVVVQSSSSSSPPSMTPSTLVSPGQGLQLSLSKRLETTRVTSQCRHDSNYDRQECVSRCQQKHTTDVCGCSISLDSPLTQRCQVNTQYQFVCQMFIQVLTDRNQLPCECPPPCREEVIDVSKSNFQWLTNSTEPYIRASIEQSNRSWNASVLRNSLAKIEVTWVGAPFIRLRQEKETELWQLFLQLGALSAITVGISVVTCIELVWLIGKALMTMCCAVVQPDQGDKVQHIYQPPDFQPEFDSISWRNYPKDTEMGGQIEISSSPLNRRKVYGFLPRPNTAWGIPDIQEAAEKDKQNEDTFYYQGHDSGFVYGHEPNYQPVFQEAAETMDLHNVYAKEENDLFSRPWEKTGNSRAYTNVLVAHEKIENNDMPFLNAPDTTLKEPIKNFTRKKANEDSFDDDLRLHLPLDLDVTRHTIEEDDRTRQSMQENNRTRQSLQENDRTRETSHDMDLARYRSQEMDLTRQTSDEFNKARYTSDEQTSKGDKNPPLLQRLTYGAGPFDEAPVKETDHNDSSAQNITHNASQPMFAISGNQVRESNFQSHNEPRWNRGPDLSKFHPTTGGPSSFQQRKNSQSKGGFLVWRNNKGLTRSKENMTRPLNETTPALGNFFHRSKIITPYTWHHAGDNTNNQNRAFVPSAYMTSAYDGRTAIYRPQTSHFGEGGATLQNENGETFYMHS